MANSAKRRRALERQRRERQQERRVRSAARRRRTAIGVGVGAVVALLAAVGLAAAGVFDGGDDTPQAGGSAACEYRETDSAAVPDIGVPEGLQGGSADAGTATLSVNGSPVTIELEPDAAPCTVHSFDFLAAADYFDDTACHRLTTSDSLQVLQCGDPTESGSGGPGYEFDNENTDDADYPAGTVAMANSGPDTNGSQFFLVYGDSDLPPDYTVFGHITEGLDDLRTIASAGTDDGSDDGAPTESVTIDDVTTAAANLDEDSP